MEDEFDNEAVGWPHSPVKKDKPGQKHVHHYEQPLWICACGDELREASYEG